MSEDKILIKNTGATFTPKGLANYLSERILTCISKNNLCVLDPACGEGELLIAMSKALQKRELDFEIVGFDSNKNYLKIAEERLIKNGGKGTHLIHGDFLELTLLNNNQHDLLNQRHEHTQNVSADIIIANPPYVRTQNLGAEQSQALAKKFNLKGRIDLYYPFLIAMTAQLKLGGILGVITSNRYLSTKSGESVRMFLAENYDILEVIDLGDTKLFEAAVLPAIFIGRKKERKTKVTSDATFIKVYEDQNKYVGNQKLHNDIYSVLQDKNSGYFITNSITYKKTIGKLKLDNTPNSVWSMLTSTEETWTSTIKKNSANLIKDLYKVRVGIKTTADKVFIGEHWDEMEDNKPEEVLLKDLISQENIGRWRSSSSKLKVLYPHYKDNGIKCTIDLNSYPKAKKYFEGFESQLKGRKYLIDAGRRWYEIWVSHDPEIWKLPKLVFPDISNMPRFLFDVTGKITNGNCYWIVAKNEKEVDGLLLIQGIANSKLMTKYHDLVFKNKLYSGRRRYLSQYVEQYPLPDLESNSSRQIVATVKRLNAATNDNEINELEENLEILVAEAFGVETVLNLH
jgi:SAM-dependent methyltransferase